MEENNKLSVCESINIRKEWHNEQWYFSVVDVIEILTDCVNTQGILRIVMSVPSPKRTLKQWLAQVGTERIQETENSELLMERQIALYKAKGYPDEWIKRRRKGIDVRKELTDEWEKRGVEQSKDFSILTATIAKGTFGLSSSEHSKLKGLEKENLREHMTTLELKVLASLAQV